MSSEQNPDKSPLLINANYDEIQGRILHVGARIEFSPGQEHTLSLDIYRTIPPDASGISYKHLPLVVRLLYRRVPKKFADYYSFDNDGACLVHTYEIYERGTDGLYNMVEEGKRDRRIKKLIEHQENISKMINKAGIEDEEFREHPLISAFREKTLEELQFQE